MLPTPLPLLLLFAVRVDLADHDLINDLGALVPAGAGAEAAAPASAPQRRPAAPRGRPHWGWGQEAGERARRLPPPISSLRGRPALVRTRTGDGRLVIARHGDGAVERGGLVCARRREGEGHLAMRLVPRDGLHLPPPPPPRSSSA